VERGYDIAKTILTVFLICIFCEWTCIFVQKTLK